MRIALIGAGSIGRIHAGNIAAHPEAELAIVCDTNQKTADRVREIHGGIARHRQRHL